LFLNHFQNRIRWW